MKKFFTKNELSNHPILMETDAFLSPQNLSGVLQEN